MKKKLSKRLSLSRETVRGLDLDPAGHLFKAVGGSTNTTAAAVGYCCTSVTSPIQVQSSYCHTALDNCACSTGQG